MTNNVPEMTMLAKVQDIKDKMEKGVQNMDMGMKIGFSAMFGTMIGIYVYWIVQSSLNIAAYAQDCRKEKGVSTASIVFSSLGLVLGILLLGSTIYCLIKLHEGSLKEMQNSFLKKLHTGSLNDMQSSFLKKGN